jgi:hypothetical protein
VPGETPLSASVQQFIEGFAEPEVRNEFTEEARRLAARGMSSSDVITRLGGGWGALLPTS